MSPLPFTGPLKGDSPHKGPAGKMNPMLALVQPLGHDTAIFIFSCHIKNSLFLHSIKSIKISSSPYFNSLVPGRCCNSWYQVFKQILMTDILSIFYEIATRHLHQCSLRWWCTAPNDPSCPIYCYRRHTLLILTHWGRDKMAAIFQTAFSNAFSRMNFDYNFSEVCS